MYFVSILRSIPTGRFYVGSSSDISECLAKHNKGYSKATKPYLPWKVVHFELFKNKSDAIKREYEIKRMKSRLYIEQRIRHDGENARPPMHRGKAASSPPQADRRLRNSPSNRGAFHSWEGRNSCTTSTPSAEFQPGDTTLARPPISKRDSLRTTRAAPGPPKQISHGIWNRLNGMYCNPMP